MRIMTSNIWGDYFKNPVDVREDFLYDVLKKYDADFIGFQEVTPNWHKGEMFKWLLEDYNFVGTEISESKNYVPFVYKKEYFLVAKGYELFFTPEEISKGITWGVFKKPDGSFIGICNTHFWWMSGPEHDVIRDDNALKLIATMKFIKEKYNCPVFAFGDLNCTRSANVFNIFKENGVEQLYDIAENKDNIGSHHGNPVLGDDGRYHGTTTDKDCEHSIDHILALKGDCKVLEYRIVEDQKALDATDHSPVYVDVEF